MRTLISDYFGGKELHTEINPDEAIAIGAAAQASVLANQRLSAFDGFSGNRTATRQPLPLATQLCMLLAVAVTLLDTQVKLCVFIVCMLPPLLRPSLS